MGMEPVHRPSRGSHWKTTASRELTRSWRMTITMATARKVNTFLPPFFSRRKQAV